MDATIYFCIATALITFLVVSACYERSTRHLRSQVDNANQAAANNASTASSLRIQLFRLQTEYDKLVDQPVRYVPIDHVTDAAVPKHIGLDDDGHVYEWPHGWYAEHINAYQGMAGLFDNDLVHGNQD